MKFLLLAAGVVVALGGGIATATAIADDAAMIHACAKDSNGRLRIVESEDDCRRGEFSVSWNSEGQVGPQGIQGEVGPQGDTGPQGDKGDDGESAGCSVVDNGDDTATLSCDDGTSVLIPIVGTDQSCASGGVVNIGGTDYTLFKDGTQIVIVSPSLVAGGFQSFTVSTCGWTNGYTLLNIFETGAIDPFLGWDEEHTLPTTSRTPGDNSNPPLESIELAIDHVNSISELTGPDKTLFNTDEAGSLTFAVRVYLPDGSLADCVAWGDDVPAMFSGNVPANNIQGPTNLFEISASNCADVS